MPTTTLTLTITGSGMDPFTISPSNLDFGKEYIGINSREILEFTMTNISGSPVTITNIDLGYNYVGRISGSGASFLRNIPSFSLVTTKTIEVKANPQRPKNISTGIIITY